MANVVKPFLKWAGGKKQLIQQILAFLPEQLNTGKFTYIEPFVGSGAVLFRMLTNFPDLARVVINDINQELINTYQIIKENPYDLICLLEGYQKQFFLYSQDENKKKSYYYEQRNLYNNGNVSLLEKAALFIFLNRTCFNGLYRVNRNNHFNVPMGNYKNPIICNKDNIIAVSEALQKVEILCDDFSHTLDYASENTIFYLDPPYKPLNKTSSFNSYSKNEFNDQEQIRLSQFCNTLSKKGYKWILSNSDVKSVDPKNNFFDDLYKDFTIKRVEAKRSINSNGQKRGPINELLVINI